tara:strand:- start:3154 stop:3513 length:360 start_codon:yes stop_codon:yes gene_type:complete
VKALGDRYEALAADWLSQRGLKILERNFRSRTGEIDIIALDQGCLVFVEVRARGNPCFSTAAASVTHHKQRRIIATAQRFLQSRPRLQHTACRFDVVAFEAPEAGEPAPIRWIRSAFTA